MRRLSVALIAALSGVAISHSAAAADMPVKAPPTAAVASSGAYYFWVDGSYQSIPLPTFDTALKHSGAGYPDLGSAQSFDPTTTGAGVSGAFGFFVPWLGQSARIEVGGSYIRATDSQFSTAGNFRSAAQLVDGSVVDYGCNLCNFAATLDTTYKSWTINAKGAFDIRSGAVVWSPYLKMFGGRSTVDQNFSQAFAFVPVSASNTTPGYLVNSDLHWTDWGARIGLDMTVPYDKFVFGAGGDIGFADRNASLSANDNYFGDTSAISASANITPFLAHAEVNLGYRFLPGAIFKAFVGLNYDSAVPGISRPTYAGSAVVTAMGTPAGIKHESETSWYAGGRFVVDFGSVN